MSIEDKIAKIIKDAYAGTGFEDEGRSTEAAHDIMAHVSHGWQPIETAPRDEMFIYYWKRDGRRAIGLAYHAAAGGFRDSEGHWNEQLKPTHWMPIPEPPK